MRRVVLILAALVVLGTVALALFVTFRPEPVDKFAECRSSKIAGGGVTIGGPFELTNQDGVRVTDKDVIDRPALVYFGYTFCPDVCPYDTFRNAEATKILAERGFDVKPVMFTIDPARDTPETMKAFVGYLSDKMVGLTGTQEEITKAEKAYRVYAAKQGDGEDYLMDHSTSTYLMAPGYGFLEFFPRTMEEEEMADKVQCFVEKL